MHQPENHLAIGGDGVHLFGEIVDGIDDLLRGFVPHDLGHGRIGREDPPFRRAPKDAHGGILEDAAIALLAFAQVAGALFHELFQVLLVLRQLHFPALDLLQHVVEPVVEHPDFIVPLFFDADGVIARL